MHINNYLTFINEIYTSNHNINIKDYFILDIDTKKNVSINQYKVSFKTEYNITIFDEFLDEISQKIFNKNNISTIISGGQEGLVFNLLNDKSKVIKLYFSLFNTGTYDLMKEYSNYNKSPFVNIYDYNSIQINNDKYNEVIKSTFNIKDPNNITIEYIIMDKINTKDFLIDYNYYYNLIIKNKVLPSKFTDDDILKPILEYVYHKRENILSQFFYFSENKYDEFKSKLSKSDLDFYLKIELFSEKLLSIADYDTISELNKNNVGYDKYNQIKAFDLVIEDAHKTKHNNPIVID